MSESVRVCSACGNVKEFLGRQSAYNAEAVLIGTVDCWSACECWPNIPEQVAR